MLLLVTKRIYWWHLPKIVVADPEGSTQKYRESEAPHEQHLSLKCVPHYLISEVIEIGNFIVMSNKSSRAAVISSRAIFQSLSLCSCFVTGSVINGVAAGEERPEKHRLQRWGLIYFWR